MKVETHLQVGRSPLTFDISGLTGGGTGPVSGGGHQLPSFGTQGPSQNDLTGLLNNPNLQQLLSSLAWWPFGPPQS